MFENVNESHVDSIIEAACVESTLDSTKSSAHTVDKNLRTLITAYLLSSRQQTGREKESSKMR